MDKDTSAATETIKASDTYNLTPVTIQELTPWRMSNIPRAESTKLEKLVFYNFKDYVATLDDAFSFLREHRDGIAVMGPARLRHIFIDWTIIEVEFETMEQKQAALKYPCLKYGTAADGKFVENVSPLPLNGRYQFLRLKNLPLEPPLTAVARLRKSMPTFIDYWRRQEYARPKTIDIVAEGLCKEEDQKVVYSGNMSIIIEGGVFSKKSLRERLAYIDGYGQYEFEIYGTVFHEYCHNCRILNGGHGSDSCPKALSSSDYD